MDGIVSITYPTPSDEEIRGKYEVEVRLDNPIIRDFEENHRLPLTLMWEKEIIPTVELPDFISDEFFETAVSWVRDGIILAKWLHVCDLLAKDYPWLSDLCFEDYLTSQEGFNNIKAYNGHVYLQEYLFHKGADPFLVSDAGQIYVYCLRYGNPADYDKLYEMVGIERSKTIEDKVDKMIEGIYDIVASDDSGAKKKLKSYMSSLKVTFSEDLAVIAAERMIQANDDVDLTDRLVMVLDEIDQTSKKYKNREGYTPYLDLLKIILYRINDPIVAIDIIEDQKKKYRGADLDMLELATDMLEVVTDITDDYVKNRLKVESTDTRYLLKRLLEVMYPDNKIQK